MRRSKNKEAQVIARLIETIEMTEDKIMVRLIEKIEVKEDHNPVSLIEIRWTTGDKRANLLFRYPTYLWEKLNYLKMVQK